MNGAERSVQLLGLAVGSSRRARFIEEWQADLVAARSLGMVPREIVAAATRVAAFLLWIRVRAQVLRRRKRGELLTLGSLLGFGFVIFDLPLAGVVPFVLLATGWRCWRALRGWIDGDR